MGIIQGAVRARGIPPQITAMSQGDTTVAQRTVSYTANVPTVIGGTPPLSFFGTDIPAGMSVNSSNGTITGTPTTPTPADYYGASVPCSITVSDAQLRTNTRNLNIIVYTPPELGFEPAAPRSYSGTSGLRGLQFDDQAGQTFPRGQRLNNGFPNNAIRWWGPLNSGFPGYSQFEVFWTITSGTAWANAAARGVWINISAGPNLILQTAGSFAVELRPVGGSSVGVANFTFS